MRELFKKVLILFLIFALTIVPASAKDSIKAIVNIKSDISIENVPDEVYFKTIKETFVNENLIIPKRSIVTGTTIQAQKERRWHKSGFLICKLNSYIPEHEETAIDISDKNIFVVVRKYEKVDKKEASILAVEILLTQAASFFAPGVDILYFFTKGAIQREKHYNWFKAGVHNAYENSICWFWLKGKPITVAKNEKVKLKSITEEKAAKLKTQIDRRQEKDELKNDLKEIKAEYKQLKKDLKETAVENSLILDALKEATKTDDLNFDL